MTLIMPIDICIEPPFYTAAFEATQAAQPPEFRMPLQVDSPAASIKEARNFLIGQLLQEEIESTGIEPDSFTWESMASLLDALPASVPVTDPYVTDFGSICFDWDLDPANQLSILLKGNGEIAYALFTLGGKMHGEARFSGNQLPEDLSLAIHKWLKGAHSRRLQA